MSRRPTPGDRAEYAAFSAARLVARLLPDAAADRLASALGRLAYRPLGIRRTLVEAHLRHAFPERDDAWIRSTAAASYAHLAREVLATLRLSSQGREEILARTTVDGMDALRAALAAGRGAAIVTGHIGNWELAGAALAARGIPLHVVVQRQRNPLFDRAVTEARGRLGMRVIERRSAPRAALRALRRGEAVAFVADQDARRTGVFVPFFGRPASTHRGAALLAVRAGAPLFAGAMLREGAGYRGWIEELTVDREGELDDVVVRLTAAFTARLEEEARRRPEQYFWHHKRWRTRPPEEPSPGRPVY